MPDGLCAVVCRHFRPEAEAVVASSSLERVRVGCLPAHCGQPCLTWEDLEAVRSRPEEPLVVFGGACLGHLDEAGARARSITLKRLSLCAEVLVNPGLLRGMLDQGAYVLTPGWLADWRRMLARQGEDPEVVRALWRESVTRLILLDTGVGEVRADFQDLREYLGLPGEVLPLGLDHLQLMVEREVLDARLHLHDTRAEGSLQVAQRQAADRATAIEFLGSLGQTLREEEVVQGIVDLFRMLFHAETVAFLPWSPEGRLAFVEEGRPYAETARGFVVPLGTSMGQVGYLHVDGIAFPQFKGHYLNLALSMAGVCALAVQNAQTYRAVEESRAYQRLMLDVLDVFYQPQGSGQDLATALAHLQAFARVDALALRMQEEPGYASAHATGYPEGFLDQTCTRCLGALEGGTDAPAGAHLSPRGSLWIDDLQAGAGACPCRRAGYRSVAMVRLHMHDRVAGVLQMHHREPGHFTPALVERLEGATRSIAIGLERRWSEQSLQLMNRELEDRVRARTTELATINRTLRQEIQERARAEDDLEVQSAELQARLRELHCLFELSNLFEVREASAEDLCRRAIRTIPSAWPHPERTFARLRLDGVEHLSEPFRTASRRHAAPLSVGGSERGVLEVFLEPEPGLQPHPGREQDLLRTMADLVQGLVDRAEVEADKRKVEEQLLQSQKLEAIGTLAGGIAHDFNNALTPISSLAELSLMKLPEENPMRRHFELIKKSADRAKGLVDQIMLFSRRRAPRLVPLELRPLLKEIMTLMRATLPATIEIVQDFPEPGCRVLGDPTQVHQIVMNLCTNAFHAMQDHGGTLRVSLAPVQVRPGDTLAATGLPPGDYARLEVSDTGCGMSREVQARIFEPFFTTKVQGRGTGMGLSVVHGIVASYQGRITVYSEPGQGTTFRVFLPRVAEAAAPAEAPEAEAPRGSGRVLVVDDEPEIRWTLGALLESLGYTVTAVEGGPQALERYRQDPEAWDLVVTDMTMPRLTGLELAEEVHRLRPGARVVLCSGFSDRLDARALASAGVREFVQKPFALVEVARALRRELDRSA